MRIWGVLSVILFGTNSATAVTHSLRYLHTAASGIPAFPEFVTVVLVDGQPFSYYDSSIRRELPRQTWTVQTEDPDFWERRTKRSMIVDEQVFKSKVEMIKQSFNQTGGDFHTFRNKLRSACKCQPPLEKNAGLSLRAGMFYRHLIRKF